MLIYHMFEKTMFFNNFYFDAPITSQHPSTSSLFCQDAQAILLQQWESMEDSARWSDPDDGPVPAAEPVAPAPAAPNDAATPSRRRAPEASGRRAKKPRLAASRVKDAAAADAAGAGGADGDAGGRWFRPGQAVVTCESSEDEEHDEGSDEEDTCQLKGCVGRGDVA